mmetsp:Transcript_8238/g.13795  ORF Transcript_8238/g.13795 Transcript_8238/m.13795 type:complete len:135 (+) Transcript_8238:834-1238(+)
MSTEDAKLKEMSVGLFNADYGNQARMKLNLSDVPHYSLFEGEIIVAEGQTDTKKFNVNRIWKPEIKRHSLFTRSQLQEASQLQRNKSIQIMVACGPFTVNNELTYDGLKDLMQVVVRDMPHTLILTGPFASQTN